MFCGQSQQLYETGIPQLQALFRTLLVDCAGNFPLISSTRFFYLAAAFLFELGLHANPLREHMPQAAQPKNEPDYITGFLRWRGEGRNGRSDQEILEPFLGNVNSSEYIEWQVGQKEIDRGRRNLGKYRALTRNTAQSRLFRTDQGLMGMCPKETQSGDLVCVLLGCNAPFILRQIDSHYVLIGVCFVLGLMSGEAMQDLKKGKVHLQEFNIL
jgi:hypothetical protein